MDGFTTAELQAVVAHLKEEIDCHVRCTKHLQRENAVLIRTILRLQQQQRGRQQPQKGLEQEQGSPCLLPGHGESEEKELAGNTTHVALSNCSSVAITPPLCSSGSPTTMVGVFGVFDCGIASSPREQDEVRGEQEQGLPHNGDDNASNHGRDVVHYRNQVDALQKRVQTLERGLAYERQRRKRQKEDYDTEIELLEMTLKEAKKCEAKPDALSTHPTEARFRDGVSLELHSCDSHGEGGRSADGRTMSIDAGVGSAGCGGGRLRRALSAPTTMESLHGDVREDGRVDKPRMAGSDDDDNETTDSVISRPKKDTKTNEQDNAPTSNNCGYHTPEFTHVALASTSSPITTLTSTVGGMQTSSKNGMRLSPRRLECRSVTFPDVCETTQSDFFTRTASRMEGRRQRLRRVAQTRTSEEISTEAGDCTDVSWTSSPLPCTGPSSPVRRVSRTQTGRIPFISAPNTTSTNATLSCGYSHLHHRRTKSALTPLHVDVIANMSKCTSLTSMGQTFAATTPFSPSPAAVAVPFNPNQLGVEVDPKGVHNRTWYIHQMFRLTFRKIIQSSSDACASPTDYQKLDGIVHGDHAAQENQEVDKGKYSDFSDSASSSSSSESRNPSPAAVMDHVSSHVVPPTTEGGALYRSTPSAAVKRAIDEEIQLRFRCSGNAVVMETLSTPFPRELPSFHEENSDRELIETFVAGGFSPSRVRQDEACITVHAPVLFSQIRSFLHMDVDGLRAALSSDCVWREALSPGKSGTTLIYFGNFVMKSVKENEFRFLKKRFLGRYVAFCERNPYTMLPRFFLLLSLTWLRTREHGRYVLMQNVFATRYYIHHIYDVKGSTVGRSATTNTTATTTNTVNTTNAASSNAATAMTTTTMANTSTPVDNVDSRAPRTSFGALLQKDNDLPAQVIICGALQRAHLLAQFRSDTAFLQALNVVDYSCLIGIRSRIFSRKEGPSKTIILKERLGTSWQQTISSEAIGVGSEHAMQLDKSCIFGCDGGLLSLPIYTTGDDTTAREDVYYIGIIDVLQEYTPAKRLESFAKGLWSDRRQISVVPPKEFAERLYKVLENITV